MPRKCGCRIRMRLYEQYKEKRNQVKRTVRAAKVSPNERWDRKITENFHKNRMFWKEVQSIRKRIFGNEQRV